MQTDIISKNRILRLTFSREVFPAFLRNAHDKKRRSILPFQAMDLRFLSLLCVRIDLLHCIVVKIFIYDLLPSTLGGGTSGSLIIAYQCGG